MKYFIALLLLVGVYFAGHTIYLLSGNFAAAMKGGLAVGLVGSSIVLSTTT